MDVLSKILYLISKNGMTELEFTQKLGVNKTTVTEWKNGKTQSYRKHISKIASILNVTEDFLLNESPANPKFAKRIKELRLDNEISERWGSAIFDVSKEDLYTWEVLGILPSNDVLNKLSDFYNVPVAYLTGEDDVLTSKKELPKTCSVLIALRKQHGLTRKELSKKIDMPILKIILFETINEIDTPSLNDYIKFSDFYKVSIDYLLGREDFLGNSLTEKEADILFLFNQLTLSSQIKAQYYMLELHDKESVAADPPLKKAK